MSCAEEWDERFRGNDHASPAADPFLVTSRKYWPLVGAEPPASAGEQPGSGRKAIDVACGAGRHAVYLAEAGFEVTAVDFSGEGLEKARRLARSHGVSIDCQAIDLEAPGVELGEGTYDLAAVFFFLHRPLFAALRRCLRPGGLLVYKTYTVDQSRYPGRPKHPMHLLAHNELLGAFAGFRVLRYEEEWEGRGTAALVAQKP